MTILSADVPVVGIAGAGRVARLHLDAWRELGVRAHVFSPHGAAALAAEYGEGVTPASSWGELLQRCAVIDICTPTDTHVALAAEAIAARRHVICEKPLALDAHSAAGLATAAAAAGVLLLPAHVVRFVPAYEALHTVVASGRLGTVVFARFTRARRAPGWGGWFRDEARSGGIIFDQTVHDIDQALRIAGPAVRVLARRVVSPDAATASTMLALSHDRGAVSHIVGLWGAPRTPFRTTYRVTGTVGTVSHDSVAAPALRVRGAAAESPDDIELDAGAASPFTAELAEFLRAVTSGAPARVDASDGVAAVAVAEAALESAATGRAVRIAGATDGTSERTAS